MITRKENLLAQPFQHKKFIQHRLKVNTALPRIDDVSPVERNHVYLKCKKLQIEAERQKRIERENFILLKHLSEIMTAKRVDNSWLCELPKFQNRVKLFRNRSQKAAPASTGQSEEVKKVAKRVKENCVACNPDKFITPMKIPEERVPWETKVCRETRSAGNENKKRILPQESKERTEISDIRRSHHLNRRRQKRIPSAGYEYKPVSRHFHTSLDEKRAVVERPSTLVVKFPTLR